MARTPFLSFILIVVLAASNVQSARQPGEQYAPTPSEKCSEYKNCIEKCPDGSFNAAFVTMFDFHSEIQHSINMAVKTLELHTGVASEDSWRPHMTIMYQCCHTLSEYWKMAEALHQLEWTAFDVTFSHAICVPGGEGQGHPNRTSVVVVADGPSQKRLLDVVGKFEAAIIERGVPIKRPRSMMEPFHATIGVVKPEYPLAEAMKEVNEAVPVWDEHPVHIEAFGSFIPPLVFRYHKGPKLPRMHFSAPFQYDRDAELEADAARDREAQSEFVDIETFLNTQPDDVIRAAGLDKLEKVNHVHLQEEEEQQQQQLPADDPQFLIPEDTEWVPPPDPPAAPVTPQSMIDPNTGRQRDEATGGWINEDGTIDTSEVESGNNDKTKAVS